MTKFAPSLLAATSFLFGVSSLFAAPAHALAPVTFFSGKGVDSGACASPTSPCRTFQFALAQTNVGGEIKALDPANYFPVAINKAISLTGVEGASIIRGSAGDAIVINAGATAAVSLTDLTLDGFNRTATNGVRLATAAKLTIRNCTVRNFATYGIFIFPTAAASFLIEDTIVANTGSEGVMVNPARGIAAKGLISRVSSTNNSIGVRIAGALAQATVSDSLMLNNLSDGILVGDFSETGGKLRLDHSRVTGSPRGVRVLPSYVAESAGDNLIEGNAVNITPAGALVIVGTH